MRYELLIRPDALDDIEASADWYEAQEPGVGYEFIKVVRTTIQTIPSDFNLHRVRDMSRNIRWCYPPRFPYRIVYRVQEKQITILAVLHAARHDREWKKRT